MTKSLKERAAKATKDRRAAAKAEAATKRQKAQDQKRKTKTDAKKGSKKKKAPAAGAAAAGAASKRKDDFANKSQDELDAELDDYMQRDDAGHITVEALDAELEAYHTENADDVVEEAIPEAVDGDNDAPAPPADDANGADEQAEEEEIPVAEA